MVVALLIVLGVVCLATAANRPSLHLAAVQTMMLLGISAAVGTARMLVDLTDPFFEIDVAIGRGRPTQTLRYTLGDSYNPFPVARDFARRHGIANDSSWVADTAAAMRSLDPARGVRHKRRGRTRLIFVHSTGRCGTEYLARLLATSDDVASFHEAPPQLRTTFVANVSARGWAATFAARAHKARAVRRDLAERVLPGALFYAARRTLHTFYVAAMAWDLTAVESFAPGFATMFDRTRATSSAKPSRTWSSTATATGSARATT